MREVVVTGYGIVSCLGNDIDAVTESLKNSNSGITINEINNLSEEYLFANEKRKKNILFVLNSVNLNNIRY